MCTRHCFNHWGFNNEPNESPTETADQRSGDMCSVWDGVSAGGVGGWESREESMWTWGTALSGVGWYSQWRH